MTTALMLVSFAGHVGMCLYAVWLAWRLQDALEANGWAKVLVDDWRDRAYAYEEKLDAVVDAARVVITRHDGGNLDPTPRSSVVIEELRQICDTIEEG